jgi:hypothetical protein
MKLEIVLIGFVTFFLVAAVAVKKWEEWERKKQNEELNTGSRRIFSGRRN